MERLEGCDGLGFLGLLMYLYFVSLIQIIYESLPVSSSTHVRLIELLYARYGYDYFVLPEYLDHLLHGPTLVVLAVFFRQEVLGILSTLVLSVHRRHAYKMLCIVFKIIGFALLASLPPVLLMYGVIKPYVKNSMLFTNDGFLLVGMLITMLSLFSLRLLSKSAEPLTMRKTCILGVVQACALLPGISRFASTYVAARWLKLSPRRAFETCFLVQVPLLVAAFFINGVPGFLTEGCLSLITPLYFMCVLGATIIAYGMLYGAWVLSQRGLFWLFGCYMVLPITILLFALF